MGDRDVRPQGRIVAASHGRVVVSPKAAAGAMATARARPTAGPTARARATAPSAGVGPTGPTARARPASAQSAAINHRVHVSSGQRAGVLRAQTPELRALAESTAEREELQRHLDTAAEFGQQMVLQLAEEEADAAGLRTQLAAADAELRAAEDGFAAGRAADEAELQAMREVWDPTAWTKT